jgi:hypothetical protein
MRRRVRDLFVIIKTYMESKQMLGLLQDFKMEFDPFFQKETDLLTIEMYDPEDEPALKILNRFKRFLEPFPFFDEYQLKEDALKKLTSILANTGYILKNIKRSVKNEADIYNEVKWIVGLYYPQTRRRGKAAFISIFKSYHPDILVPELESAVEYKYLKEGDNVDEYMDQLKVDAANYKGDDNYKEFFAVVYIDDISIATPESIEETWELKKFPENWHLVIAGHKISNTKGA